MKAAPPIRTLPLALAALAAVSLAFGCTSFDRLRSGDPAVDELEVFAAGQADDGGELTGDLHRLLERHSEYSSAVIVAAIGALSDRGDPASVAYIARLAEHPDEEVRFHVAAGLKALGGPEATATLARMGRDDQSDLVREEALGQ